MHSISRLVVMVAGLVLVSHMTPCWGQGVNPTASDGNANTAGGSSALVNALNTVGSGSSNTAFGEAALAFTTTGNGNTATGSLALEYNTTGSNNTACGAFALNQSTGNNNAAVGASALANNSTGSGNTASGGLALQANTNGTNNTAIGFKALKKSTGTKNIGIGYQAGATLSAGNNNIYIGNTGAGNEFQTIRVGTAQTSTFIAGIGTTPIVANGATVEIDTITGQLGVAGGSSARYKQDIAPMGSQSADVLQLRPVTFAYKEDLRHVKHFGLIAEEVAAVYPELVTRTATGEVQTVRYQELIPMLLNEVQRQRQELQQTLQSQAQALQSHAQALQRQQQELADLRVLVGPGRETASLAR